jgi:enamine deaminase RidA (YjgF/YER057c/UK114 family)
MTGTIKKRLKELAIELPVRPSPVANYVSYVQTGNLLFVSGQLPFTPGNIEQFQGMAGSTLSLADARAGARAAAINVVAVLDAALEGDLDRVTRVVKITGFVNSTAAFVDHPEVINGASNLFVEVFGDAGRHARAAVGVSSLPRNAVVEVEAVFEIT